MRLLSTFNLLLGQVGHFICCDELNCLFEIEERGREKGRRQRRGEEEGMGGCCSKKTGEGKKGKGKYAGSKRGGKDGRGLGGSGESHSAMTAATQESKEKAGSDSAPEPFNFDNTQLKLAAAGWPQTPEKNSHTGPGTTGAHTTGLHTNTGTGDATAEGNVGTGTCNDIAPGKGPPGLASDKPSLGTGSDEKKPMEKEAIPSLCLQPPKSNSGPPPQPDPPEKKKKKKKPSIRKSPPADAKTQTGKKKDDLSLNLDLLAKSDRHSDKPLEPSLRLPEPTVEKEKDKKKPTPISKNSSDSIKLKSKGSEKSDKDDKKPNDADDGGIIF